MFHVLVAILSTFTAFVDLTVLDLIEKLLMFWLVILSTITVQGLTQGRFLLL